MTEAQLGKYRLLKLLATGGMGEVLLARQEGPAGFMKTVVVKRMLTHLGRDPKFVEMFLNEARLAAQLSHPNIVQIFELGEQDGTYFLAMEFIHGVNLRFIKRRFDEQQLRVPILFAAWACAQALKGLHHAHTLTDESGASLNIVHRDVSPDNILVGFNCTVKMVDFGIAKASTSISTTGAGTFKGKFAYMAPEQLSGQPADPRSDIYAMGVLLFELVGGGRPFKGSSEGELVKCILQDEPRPLRELRPDVPEELEETIRRAMARNPAERFSSAEAMSSVLESFIIRSGGLAPDEIKTLLRSLFGEEVDLVTPRPMQPAPWLSPAGGTATAPMPVPPNAGSPHRTQDPLKAISLELSLKDIIPSDAEALPDAMRPPPAVSGPTAGTAARGARLGLWGALAVTVLLLGAGLGFRALRPAGGSEVPAPPVATAPTPKPAAASPTPAPPDPGAVALSAEPAAVGPPSTQPDAQAPEPQTPPAVASKPAAVTPAVKRSPRPPAKAVMGTVAVRVNPWAEVLHDGKRLGVTPMPPFELPSGPQTLTLVNKDLDVEKKIRVVVPPSREVVVRVNLLEGL
jgi:eukaryotic-like serine/threonine-protein kinase